MANNIGSRFDGHLGFAVPRIEIRPIGWLWDFRWEFRHGAAKCRPKPNQGDAFILNHLWYQGGPWLPNVTGRRVHDLLIARHTGPTVRAHVGAMSRNRCPLWAGDW